jgi:hypothetical protein
METYAAKWESKVTELEEILESMESNMSSKTESEAKNTSTHVNDDDPVQKLKTENDWLREVLIRATREEVTNAREDTIKLKPKDSMLFNIKEKVMPSDTISALPESVTTTNDASEVRKSLKVSHSFIKRQNSSKKIQKGKVTRDEPEKPIIPAATIPHRREHSSSTSNNSRTLSRKDMENIISLSSRDSINGIPHSAGTLPLSSSDVKLPPLSSVHEVKHSESEKPEKITATPRSENNSSIRLPRLSLSSKPPIDEQLPNKVIPLTARFEKVQLQTTFAPSPHKLLQRTATVSTSPKWVEANNENAPPALENPHNSQGSITMNPNTPKAGSNRMSLHEVVQKFHDFEKRVVVKEKSIETEQHELKRQVDDMKNSLDNLVLAINILTQKVVPS